MSAFENTNAFEHLEFEARVLNVNLGRFLSVDPEYSDFASINAYCFAVNNPVLLIDEFGRGPKLPYAFVDFMKGL